MQTVMLTFHAVDDSQTINLPSEWVEFTPIEIVTERGTVARAVIGAAGTHAYGSAWEYQPGMPLYGHDLPAFGSVRVTRLMPNAQELERAMSQFETVPYKVEGDERWPSEMAYVVRPMDTGRATARIIPR